MHEDLGPARRAGRGAVVALPERMDESNAGQIQHELLSVINGGATALIADMTATIWCDHAGADAVVRAFQRAVITGTELRLVVTAPPVSRVLSLSGVDRLVPIHPSLAAATAASAPAAMRTLTASPAGAGTGGQALPHRAGRASRPVQAAGPAGGNGEAITPAVVGRLADTLQDGVVLADAGGTIALASAPLEHMFGYGRGELDGHPVESLIPAGLQAAHRGHRARYAQAPAARPMGAGAPLVGLRKDGTTFPAQISLSPVTTPAGHLTLTVVRDLIAARRLEGLARLAQTAAAAEHEHRGWELLDTVVTSLFRAGISLQAATGLPAPAARQRIDQALGHLDEVIRQIRDTAFTTPGHGTAPQPGPPNGAAAARSGPRQPGQAGARAGPVEQESPQEAAT
jgi:anti-anti-sigma factor